MTTSAEALPDARARLVGLRGWWQLLWQQRKRIAVSLIPVVFALLHVSAVLPIPALQRLDNTWYDLRLRLGMPKTLDPRIVIVDIDEKSLGQLGRWPWGRNQLATLVERLFTEHQIALLGIDLIFDEADKTSGLARLKQLAQTDMKDLKGFAHRLEQLQDHLDYDTLFARALAQRTVVMSFELTGASTAAGPRGAQALPGPIARLPNQMLDCSVYRGHKTNIDLLAQAAPLAGFTNTMRSPDGLVRAVPLLACYQGQHYESLARTMYRLQSGQAPSQSAAWVPFRGWGGPTGGSFVYLSAIDVLQHRIPAGLLKNKMVLLGSSAPSLQALRSTPVGTAFPDVEIQANVLSALLDQRSVVQPGYATVGLSILALLLGVALALVLSLPTLRASRAVLVSATTVLVLAGMNLALYLYLGWALPLAAVVVMALAVFALNMNYGYFFESRSRRDLAQLFGTYVPPELVDEMVKNPESYSMQAAAKELTVMFCDMRGFTQMSEIMQPTQLQYLLNGIFSRITQIIRGNRGTIDKYMGDCVMAFWGAPVESRYHAWLAVKTAMEISSMLRKLNAEHRAKGLPQIGIGIGLNTGIMCVGDMGSDIRRSYTVIGDAVNLGARLEKLTKVYGVDIIASESTRLLAADFSWQELDKVRVKGKDKAVRIFWPLAPADRVDAHSEQELQAWNVFLKAYRAQDWDACDAQLQVLQRMQSKKQLYRLYVQRVAAMRMLPVDPRWDGATNFE